ncbi:MAG: 1,4-dihydroxy-2-naphthoate polyprenyltransferase [Actinomycetota bacterium]
MADPPPPPPSPPSGIGIWIAGARPRTLGVSAAPVVVGTACGELVAGSVIWWRALAALVVALALQVGVNYANDYSDGVRGTDADRRGPLRITASGLAAPETVRFAALGAFGVAALAGLALALAVDWRLLLVGALAILAAALYTGGPRPYGYLGLGEVMVFVFFGLVATCGSQYVQIEDVTSTAVWGSFVVGLPTVAVLLANNIRDIPTDALAGKRTLAVRLGPVRARMLFGLCLAGSLVAVGGVCLDAPWAVVAFAAVPRAVQPIHLVLTREDPPGLVAGLVATVRFTMAIAALTAIGIVLS